MRLKPFSLVVFTDGGRSLLKSFKFLHLICKYFTEFEFDQVVDEFEEKDIGFGPMPVFEDVRSHLASPFVIITDAIAE